MKRFLIERSYPRGLQIPMNDEGRRDCASIATVNAELGVTWMHSYVTADGRRCFCLYEAPSADAVRAATERNGLPIDRLAEVRVLDPHFYLA